MGDAKIDHRDWNAYLRDGRTQTDEIAFTDRELAVEYVVDLASSVAHDEISEEDFEQQSETVWRVDLSGPYTGIVVHTAVYSEVPDAE